MPEGANGSYTDWYNYGKGGVPKWETFHTKEVIQLMERNYHAGTARAVMEPAIAALRPWDSSHLDDAARRWAT